MSNKFFVTDCEGPLSINDNAYELSDYFIPDGGELFKTLSNYDDMLVEQNTPNYLAGSTLSLILPFFKAYNLTEQDIIEYSEDNVLLLSGTQFMINTIQNIMPSFIVSTSYNQYIQALSNKLNFSYDNTYSTKLNLDNYVLTEEEKDILLKIHDSILFDSSFENIHEIFTKVISPMDVNNIIKTVKPVGGIGKRNAIYDIINKNKFDPSNLMYSGDSITDKEALEFAKNNKGISISFNGNIHSINSAGISVLSENNLILALIAEIFDNESTCGVYDFINEYNQDPFDAITKYSDNNDLKQKLIINKMPSIDIITNENKKDLINKAQEIRELVRGKKIGLLG